MNKDITVQELIEHLQKSFDGHEPLEIGVIDEVSAVDKSSLGCWIRPNAMITFTNRGGWAVLRFHRKEVGEGDDE